MWKNFSYSTRNRYRYARFKYSSNRVIVEQFFPAANTKNIYLLQYIFNKSIYNATISTSSRKINKYFNARFSHRVELRRELILKLYNCITLSLNLLCMVLGLCSNVISCTRNSFVWFWYRSFDSFHFGNDSSLNVTPLG